MSSMYLSHVSGFILSFLINFSSRLGMKMLFEFWFTAVPIAAAKANSDISYKRNVLVPGTK